jgi:hypothetical protein
MTMILYISMKSMAIPCEHVAPIFTLTDSQMDKTQYIIDGETNGQKGNLKQYIMDG